VFVLVCLFFFCLVCFGCFVLCVPGWNLVYCACGAVPFPPLYLVFLMTRAYCMSLGVLSILLFLTAGSTASVRSSLPSHLFSSVIQCVVSCFLLRILLGFPPPPRHPLCLVLLGSYGGVAILLGFLCVFFFVWVCWCLVFFGWVCVVGEWQSVAVGRGAVREASGLVGSSAVFHYA